MTLKLVIALLGLMVCSRTCLAEGSDVTVLAGGKPETFDRMLDDLAKADVVFLGEQHDHARGHAIELQILGGLQARNPHMALALEMFERDVQGVLDEYLAGYITESSFLAASRPWPNYKADYAPLVEFCKAHGLPVIASNAPRRYVNIVSRKGREALQELPKSSRSNLAPLPYSMDLPPEYDRRLSVVFETGHNAPASGAPASQPSMPSTEHMKQAQGLWDATMADSIAKYRRKTGRTILHVNGGMHSESGFGIVARLHKLQPGIKVLTVAICPSGAYPQPPTDLPADAADYVIVTPEEHAPTGK